MVSYHTINFLSQYRQNCYQVVDLAVAGKADYVPISKKFQTIETINLVFNGRHRM